MFSQLFLTISKQLYPTGRAFKMPFGGYLEQLHKALSLSEERADKVIREILDHTIPDNALFDTDDATEWEKRLGLITNTETELPFRVSAITRKINYPGTQRARQNYRYLQNQLTLSGFDVTVYENRFPDGAGGFTTQDPITLSGGSGASINQHGTSSQHGTTQHGGGFGNKVVNSIDENVDFYFDGGPSLRNTFFVGGSPLGTFADIPASRKLEFRSLILKIKPAHTIGYLFVNYI